MSKVFFWIRDLVLFLLCFLAVTAMVPSEKYGRYIRFFGGMVLILLVMEPIASYLNLEAPMERDFRFIRFQNESRELSQEILGIEKKRKEQMFLAYEQEIEAHIKDLAAQQGILLSGAEVSLEEREGEETYGQMKRVALFLKEEEAETVRETNVSEIAIAVEEIRLEDPVETMEPVKAAAGGHQVTSQVLGEEALSKASRKMDEFVRKVEAYYGLETGDVEVQLPIR